MERKFSTDLGPAGFRTHPPSTPLGGIDPTPSPKSVEQTDPQIPSEEVTWPGVDTYLPPLSKPPPQKIAKTEKIASGIFGWFNKREELSEAKEIVGKIDRIPGAPGEVVRHFLENDLTRLMEIAGHHLKEVQALLNEAKPNPWVRLAQVACGDPQAFVAALDSPPEENEAAYLYGLQKIAPTRPREATHLLKQVFEKGGLKTRLAAFRTVAVSDSIGDGKLLGELFVKLMGATTPAERKEIVEPFFESLLQHSTKRNWLHALIHGWRTEQP